MAYSFDQVFAADPANPANIASNAAITIYQPGDPTKTPLVITDTSGGALTNPIPVNANGFGSAFMHATLDRVAWDGGGFTGFFTSYEGMKNEAVAARTAAETAGTDAAAAASAGVAGVAADAAAAQVAAESAAIAAANSAALVGAPADAAIAAAVNGTGATKTALTTAIASNTTVTGKLDKTEAATIYAVPESVLNLAPGYAPAVGDLSVAQERDTTNTSIYTRIAVPLVRDLHTIRAAFANWDTAIARTSYPDETAPANAVRYACVVETVGGLTYQLSVNGVALFSVAPGMTVLTDPLDVDIKKTDGIAYLRVYAERDAGTGGIPVSRGCYGAPTNGQMTANGTNNTVGTGPINVNFAGSGTAPAPLAVYSSGNAKKVLAIVGDSIAAGTGDSPSFTHGYISTAVETVGKVPSIKIARPSERALEFGGDPSRRPRRLTLIAGVTDAICEYGVNDLSSLTLAQSQAALVAAWKTLANRGVKVAQTTLLPKTTSTDAWLTTTNQTASGTTIPTLNDWIRDGAPILNSVAVATGSNAAGAIRAGATGHPLTRYLEIADTVETSRNSGIWKAAPAVGTVNTTNGSSIITAVTMTTGAFNVGDRIVGPGIPAGNFVAVVNPGVNIILRNGCTATATGVQVYSPMTTDGLHPTTKAVQMAALAPDLVSYLTGLKEA